MVYSAISSERRRDMAVLLSSGANMPAACLRARQGNMKTVYVKSELLCKLSDRLQDNYVVL
jgi:hypothetical protein